MSRIRLYHLTVNHAELALLDVVLDSAAGRLSGGDFHRLRMRVKDSLEEATAYADRMRAEGPDADPTPGIPFPEK